MSRIPFFTTTLAISLLLAGCDVVDMPVLSEPVSSPIVNGDIETGWQGVGALTITYPGIGHVGSFCSGTLIDPEWVLTAAHCVSSNDDYPMEPTFVRFFMGPNANPDSSGMRPDGIYARADRFFVHPSYSVDNQNNDIALVHLADRVTGVGTYAINRTALGWADRGDDVFYVGYGVSSGKAETGGGIKRSVNVPIEWVYDYIYSCDSASVNAGVCFGDSGGPGFLYSGSTPVVAGINSTVSGNNDPCIGTSYHTRVDKYQTFVDSTMNNGPPDCRYTPGVCLCSLACKSNGTCDHSLCVRRDCAEAYSCISACPYGDLDCRMSCYHSTDTASQGYIDDIFGCFRTLCAGVSGAEYTACVFEKCGDPIDSCGLGVVGGTKACHEVYSCMLGCPSGDTECSTTCHDDGTSDAQTSVDLMLSCIQSECRNLSGVERNECISANCSSQVSACLLETRCSLVTEECPVGTACYPTFGALTSCVPSDDTAEGESCVATAAGRAACEDTTVCITSGGVALCRPYCMVSGHCGEDGQCNLVSVWGGFGWCGCLDADGDKYCSVDDCDDSSADVNPAEMEACGDAVDNDCDGQTDEGCDSCVDADGDHYCVPNDCADNDNSIYPGADEVCRDGVDQDCDGVTDEGCPAVCTDTDGDGACAGDDCNDAEKKVYPGATEQCLDGLDNDCDGMTDEVCGLGCVDGDGDQACAETDCDDSNPGVYPGAPEVCWDNLDNNCDGATDLGCPSLDGSGCSAAPGSTGNPASAMWIFVLMGALFLAVRMVKIGRN